MKEKEPQFTVVDRRKFTSEGDVRPNADPEAAERHAVPDRQAASPSTSSAPASSGPTSSAPSAASGIHTVTPKPSSTANAPASASNPATAVGPATAAEQAAIEGPTTEESAQSYAAYTETTRQMDEILRTKMPGEFKETHIGFEHVIQSLYMTAVMNLGAGTPQGEKARIDLMGARQTIDMLQVLDEKTAGNLNEMEKKMLDSALFEVRLMFLEITHAIARNATQQQQPPLHPLDPRSALSPPGKPDPRNLDPRNLAPRNLDPLGLKGKR